MTLKVTRDLVSKYGEKLKNGSISKEDLLELNDMNKYRSTGFYNANNPVSETNFKPADVMKEFVEIIAKDMKPEDLHELTRRMLALNNDPTDNTYMRGSTLEKHFFAYEVFRNPDEANKHYSSEEITSHFDEKAINILKSVILKPIIEDFDKRSLETKAIEELKTFITKSDWKTAKLGIFKSGQKDTHPSNTDKEKRYPQGILKILNEIRTETNPEIVLGHIKKIVQDAIKKREVGQLFRDEKTAAFYKHVTDSTDIQQLVESIKIN